MEDFNDINKLEKEQTLEELIEKNQAYVKENDENLFETVAEADTNNEENLNAETTVQTDENSIEDVISESDNAITDESENIISDQSPKTYESGNENKSKDSVELPFNLPYSPINYTKVKQTEDKKPMSRGLKFFIFLLVGVIALTTACAGGYFLGKISVSDEFQPGNVKVGLAAKPADTDEMTSAQVYEKVNKSVVGICVYNLDGEASSASGVFYSQDGYIVTNDHIYSEISNPKFKVYTHDNKEYDAQYVAGDIVSDLAVLKINVGGFEAAEFGDSDQIIFGENVVAVGRPGGAANDSSITKGIISATSRRVQTTSSYSARLIETDCPINPGSSGGALVNMYGQVVGITSSKLASSNIDAVGYAIPTTTVKRIVEELIEKGKILSRAKLGITYRAIDSVTAEVEGLKFNGLYVDSVSEDSDLYKKIFSGDIITHINDIKVTADEIVLDIIEKSKAGDKVKVTFVNENGKTQTIEAVLKANVGESSYNKSNENEMESLPQLPGNNPDEEGAFNFPFGE